jgi:ankyrin repeat protein
MTALHNACTSDHGSVGKLKLLLDDGGADIDALNNAGESPLRLAINHQGAYSATAKYLIDCGAGISFFITLPDWKPVTTLTIVS